MCDVNVRLVSQRTLAPARFFSCSLVFRSLSHKKHSRPRRLPLRGTRVLARACVHAHFVRAFLFASFYVSRQSCARRRTDCARRPIASTYLHISDIECSRGDGRHDERREPRGERCAACLDVCASVVRMQKPTHRFPSRHVYAHPVPMPTQIWCSSAAGTATSTC